MEPMAESIMSQSTCKTCRYYRDASPIIAITPNYCKMWVAFIPHTVQTCSAHEPKENQ